MKEFRLTSDFSFRISVFHAIPAVCAGYKLIKHETFFPLSPWRFTKMYFLLMLVFAEWYAEYLTTDGL